MWTKRQQTTSPYLNNQHEPKQPIRRLESPHYDKDLSYLKHSNKSNASEERRQLNAIQNVLNNFFKGEAIARSLISKVNNSIIRNKFDQIAVQYFTSKNSFEQRERETKNVMKEVNHHLDATLKQQWPYSFKFQHNSQFINYDVLNNIVKELNEYKLCKLIINNNQQIKLKQYSQVLRIGSYRFLTKINSLASNKLTKTDFESDILLSLKYLNSGRYKEDQSVFRSFSKQIHQQLLRLDILLKQNLKQQNPQEINKSMSLLRQSQQLEQRMSQNKKQLGQYQLQIERKCLELMRSNAEVATSDEIIDIDKLINRQETQLEEIKKSLNIYGQMKIESQLTQQSQKNRIKGYINQQEQLSKGKKQLSQMNHRIEQKMCQLDRLNHKVENDSKKLVEIKSEIERWQLQEMQIKEKAHLLGHKYKVIEVLQEEKMSLQDKIDQLTKQQKDNEQKLKTLKSGFQEQDLKKTQQIALQKQQLKDNDKKMAEFGLEYQLLYEKYFQRGKKKAEFDSVEGTQQNTG